MQMIANYDRRYSLVQRFKSFLLCIGISQFSGIDFNFMFNANNTKIRPKTKKVQKSPKELKGRQREAHRML